MTTLARLPLIASLVALTASPALALPECGGSFSAFVAAMQQEAIDNGADAQAAQRFFAEADYSERTLRADRRQGIFQLDFISFAERVISSNRMQRGAQMAERYADVFRDISDEYGIPRGMLLAFWALETDYGAFQGDFNTLDSLITLSHDCRRPELFGPQVLAALELYEQGDFDPRATTGAWAGEIGMVQMLPQDILSYGQDGDGDGHVTLKTSPHDALHSGAALLRGKGWRPNEPWLREISVPDDMDWAMTGLGTTKTVAEWQELGVAPRQGSFDDTELPASVLLPMGHNGPAFLAYDNFRVLFEWNMSFTYVTTAAYFATRLDGAPVLDRRSPDPGLSAGQMERLQRKLSERGHDVGGIDGILGAKTREAVRVVQAELGLPVDAWPTPALLNRLQ